MDFDFEIIRKIDELGRVVLPLELRRALHLAEKASVRVLIKDDHLELHPVKVDK